MLVSVIIASFRQPQFLRRAISSVLTQDHQDLELIVVDDASGDSSLAIALEAQATDPRVRVLARRENGGLGRARNTGIAAARGTHLTFLDSDDYLLPGAIRARVEGFAALDADHRDDCVGVYGDWIHVPEEVDEPESVRAPRSALPTFGPEHYPGHNLFICSAPLVVADALRAVGGFAEDVPMLEDYVAWARLVGAGGRFVPVPHVIAAYRQRPSSMLRGRGPTLMAMATEINRWLDEQGVEVTALDDSLETLLSGARPEAARRVNWFRRGDHGGHAVVNHRQVATDEADHPTTTGDHLPPVDFLTRSETDLDHVLDDVDEIDQRRGVPVRRHRVTGPDPARPPAVLVIPRSLEETIEAVALVQGIVHCDVAAALALPNRRSIDENWPSVLADVPLWPLDELPDDLERAVVFNDRHPVASTVLPRIGRERLVVRTSGIEPVAVYRPDAARRYRMGDSVLVRTRLEAAELGDRPVHLLPSAVGLGAELLWGPREEGDETIVLAPSSLVHHPQVDAWVASALGATAAVHDRVVLMASPRVAARLKGFRAVRLDVARLRRARRCVLPICDEASLVEALGVAVGVFDPQDDPDAVSPLWREAHRVAATPAELTAVLGREAGADDERGRYARSMARLTPFAGDLPALGHELLTATGVDRVAS